MTAKILLIEDEDALRDIIAYNLIQAGYDCWALSDGEEVMETIKEMEPDLVVLDWMLPGVSGIELCRRIRARSNLRDLPVIMITARGEEEDKVRGLETGADDYLTKPVSMAELIARIKAVLRRARPTVADALVKFGDITLDRDSMRVRRAGREIKLGPTEFRVLDCFLKRPGRVLSRERLLDLAWGEALNVELRTVDVHVGRLRKALNAPGEEDPIRTVRSAGYALNETYQKGADSE